MLKTFVFKNKQVWFTYVACLQTAQTPDKANRHMPNQGSKDQVSTPSYITLMYANPFITPCTLSSLKVRQYHKQIGMPQILPKTEQTNLFLFFCFTVRKYLKLEISSSSANLILVLSDLQQPTFMAMIQDWKWGQEKPIYPTQ